MEAVRRSLAMGVEQAFLIDDPALEGADPLTVARALAAVLRREGCDLVLAGKQSTDDEAGLVGPMVAELLGVPCVTAAVELAVADGVATCVREVPGGRETVRVHAARGGDGREGPRRPSDALHDGHDEGDEGPGAQGDAGRAGRRGGGAACGRRATGARARVRR